jgi:hypothetical protein
LIRDVPLPDDAAAEGAFYRCGMGHLFDNPVSGIVIAVLAVGFILYRQLQKRPVKEDSGFRMPVILIAIGVLESANAVTHAAPAVLVTTALSLMTGAGFGLLRGRFVHLFREGGKLFKQGNAITIVLWIVGIGIHFGLDALGGALSTTTTASSGSSFGSATILIYIGVSLGAQQLITMQRARTVSPTLV